MSSIIVLSAEAESESSRARMEVEMLQGKQGGEGSLSGGTVRGTQSRGAWASSPHSELPLQSCSS